MSTILMYHSISAEPVDHWLQVRPDTFWQQLDWVRESGRHFASLEEVVTEPDGKGVALTFDDGFCDNEETLRALAGEGIPVYLYVCGGHLGGYANWATNPGLHDLPLMDRSALQRMVKAGVTLGSHSWWHQSFNQLSLEEVAGQLDRSLDWFQVEWGQRPETLAYPFGHCPAEVAEVIADRFSLALAVEPLPGLPPKLALPRMPALEKYTQGDFQWHLEKYDLKSTIE